MGKMYQISVYIPESSLEIVKNTMFKAGAGVLGNYEMCSWQTKGKGQFKPVSLAKPTIGKLNNLTTVTEYKLELLCSKSSLKNTIIAMKKSHPYEEVAYTVLEIIYE